MPRAKPTVRLSVVGNRHGESREVTLPLTIGRGGEADWQISTLAVSRKHCQLSWDEDGFVRARDLDSKNGTFVGDQPVRPDRPLRIPPGELLTVGPVTFRVDYAIQEPEDASNGGPDTGSPRA